MCICLILVTLLVNFLDRATLASRHLRQALSVEHINVKDRIPRGSACWVIIHLASEVEQQVLNVLIQ